MNERAPTLTDTDIAAFSTDMAERAAARRRQFAQNRAAANEAWAMQKAVAEEAARDRDWISLGGEKVDAAKARVEASELRLAYAKDDLMEQYLQHAEGDDPSSPDVTVDDVLFEFAFKKSEIEAKIAELKSRTEGPATIDRNRQAKRLNEAQNELNRFEDAWREIGGDTVEAAQAELLAAQAELTESEEGVYGAMEARKNPESPESKDSTFTPDNPHNGDEEVVSSQRFEQDIAGNTWRITMTRDASGNEIELSRELLNGTEPKRLELPPAPVRPQLEQGPAEAESDNEQEPEPRTQTFEDKLEAELEALKGAIEAARDEAIESIKAAAKKFEDINVSLPVFEAAVGAAATEAKKRFNGKSTEGGWSQGANGVDKDRREAFDKITDTLKDLIEEYKRAARSSRAEDAPAQPVAALASTSSTEQQQPKPYDQSRQGGIGVLRAVFRDQNGGHGTHTGSPAGSLERDPSSLAEEQQKQLKELEAMQKKFTVDTIETRMHEPGFKKELEEYGELLKNAKEHMTAEQQALYEAAYGAVMDRVRDLQKPTSLRQRIGRFVLRPLVAIEAKLAEASRSGSDQWYSGYVPETGLERRMARRINTLFDGLDGQSQRRPDSVEDDVARKQ